MAIGVVLFGIAIVPGVASAHHPLVSGTTQCRVDSWSVTWTARADAARGFTWEITSPSGYSPTGSQSDALPFTRTATYPAGQESATENVSARWSNQATGSGSATVQRPPECTTTTTSTTTTTTTTTTTQPEVTTTQPEVTTTQPEVTTTVAQTTPTSLVGQEGPTSTVDQSSGAATTTTVPVGRTLPATGNSSTSLVVIALTMIGIGAVMLRLTTKSTR
jgi:LPXTG-motif cell wall-anchored protein